MDIEVTQKVNFDNGMFVIKFGAEWCGPCKAMNKVLDKVRAEFVDIKFFNLDVDNSPDLAQKYKVRSIPTVIFIKDGQEIQRIVGLSLIEPVRKVLREMTKKESDEAL